MNAHSAAARRRHPGLLVAFGALAAFACGGAPPPSTTASQAPPKPTPMTADQAVDWYKRCWELFNTKAWDSFQNCYTADAKSDAVDSGQPVVSGRAAIIEAAKVTVAPNPDVRGDLQLLLANGRNMLTVALWKGTHTAPMPGPGGQSIPATGKSFGFLIVHTVELDEGRTAAQADSTYVELGTLLGQLGLSKAPTRKAMESGAASPTVVIAKGDENEAKNVAVVQALLESFNKHDLKGLGSVMDDKYVMHEIAMPADSDKKKALMTLVDLFKGFGDVKLTGTDVYAAGDYVVMKGTFDGTNTGPLVDMGLKKKTDKHVVSRFIEIFRLENGKIVEDWLFYNGAYFAGQLGVA